MLGFESCGFCLYAEPTTSGYQIIEAEQERIGVRWDVDGGVSKADGVYSKFQMQPNTGKIPSSIKQ
jgi:hypothetical protein